MAKSNIELKKECLINFIIEKMKHGGDPPAEITKTKTKIKKMSYKALKEWAIINDFIDY